MAGSCRGAWRRRSGAEKGRGKGPLGPWAHQELAGEVDWAGERPAAIDFGAEELRTCEGIGDSKHLGPIPSTGRLQAATWTFSAHRGGKGRSLAATGGDSHGLL
jgi:hypothetical protein